MERQTVQPTSYVRFVVVANVCIYQAVYAAISYCNADYYSVAKHFCCYYCWNFHSTFGCYTHYFQAFHLHMLWIALYLIGCSVFIFLIFFWKPSKRNGISVILTVHICASIMILVPAAILHNWMNGIFSCVLSEPMRNGQFVSVADLMRNYINIDRWLLSGLLGRLKWATVRMSNNIIARS